MLADLLKLPPEQPQSAVLPSYRGGKNPVSIRFGSSLPQPTACRFDGYTITSTSIDSDQAARLVASRPGDTRRDVPPPSGSGRFDSCIQVADSQGLSVGIIMWNTSILRIEVKGGRTPEFVQRIQTSGYDYQVTRMDSCIDYDFPGAWATLLDLCDAVQAAQGTRSGNPKLSGTTTTSDVAGKPATRQYGSGDLFARLYQKGKSPDCSHLNRPEWVRLELQYRPPAKSKEQARTMSPVDVWGVARWTRDLAAAAFNANPTRITPPAPTARTTQDDIDYVVRQCRGAITRISSDLGITIEEACALIAIEVQRR